MQKELADFLRYCRVEQRLAEMTCTAYERDVSACLAFLSERGIRDLGLARPPDLRAFLASEVERRPAIGSQSRARGRAHGVLALLPRERVPRPQSFFGPAHAEEARGAGRA
jgi:site-specific recombinase XerD